MTIEIDVDTARAIRPVGVELTDIVVGLGGSPVLHGVSIKAPPGSVVGLLGPNGSGKSTMLRTAFRSLRPQAGSALIDQTDLWEQTVGWAAERIAVVLQEASMDFPLTCGEVVMMGRTVHKRLLGSDSPQDWGLCHSAMALLGVEDKLDRPFSMLSGGERQRVLIARALVQQPQVLLMDEPTNHLDLHHQISLLDLTRRLGMTVIVALHDLNLASRFCDSIVLLEGGRVVEQGTPEDVLTPERIEQVYRVQTQVVPHPMTGRPHVIVC